MKNEALAKAFCHNIHCLIRRMSEDKIGMEFLSAIYQKANAAYRR